MRQLKAWCTAVAMLATGTVHAATRQDFSQRSGGRDAGCGPRGCADAPTDDGVPASKDSRWPGGRPSRTSDTIIVGGDRQFISDVTIGTSLFGVTMRQPDGSYNSATNLTIRRVDITAIKAPIAIRGGSHDILIEDAQLRCTGTTPAISGGIKIGSRDAPPNYNITIRRTTITGCISQGRKGYTQGDGIATERPDHDITIIDTTSTDHGDGCLDLKSSATRLDNITVARCNWGLRLWAQGHAGTLHIGDVRKAAVQIKPSTDWTIDRLYLPPDVPRQGDVFSDGVGGRLTIGWCSRPVTVQGGPATLMLGPTCRRA